MVNPSLIGNGVCSAGAEYYTGGAPYNTEACEWDGGDCVEFNEAYPGCTVDVADAIGDGFCDGAEFNTEACGYDGGDCLP